MSRWRWASCLSRIFFFALKLKYNLLTVHSLIKYAIFFKINLEIRKKSTLISFFSSKMNATLGMAWPSIGTERTAAVPRHHRIVKLLIMKLIYDMISYKKDLKISSNSRNQTINYNIFSKIWYFCFKKSSINDSVPLM